MKFLHVVLGLCVIFKLCSSQECPPGFVLCSNGMYCIWGGSICNGEDDCGDNSDERNPETGLCPPCPELFFQCLNGECLHEPYVCDGYEQCLDGSDETDDACPCAENEIRCNVPPSEEPQPPGACIPPEWICDEDGIWDCPDGSDEANCTVSAGKSNHQKLQRRRYIN